LVGTVLPGKGKSLTPEIQEIEPWKLFLPKTSIIYKFGSVECRMFFGVENIPGSLIGIDNTQFLSEFTLKSLERVEQLVARVTRTISNIPPDWKDIPKEQTVITALPNADNRQGAPLAQRQRKLLSDGANVPGFPSNKIASSSC